MTIQNPVKFYKKCRFIEQANWPNGDIVFYQWLLPFNGMEITVAIWRIKYKHKYFKNSPSCQDQSETKEK